MLTTIYYAESFAWSWFDEDRQVLVVKNWNLNLGTHVDLLFEANLAAVVKYQPKKIILDRSESVGMRAPKEEEAWLRSGFFLEFRKRGVKKVSIIFPKNHMSSFSTKLYVGIGKELGLEFEECESLEAAYGLGKGKTSK